MAVTMPWEPSSLWRIAQIAAYLVFVPASVMALYFVLLLLGARRSGIGRPTRRSEWVRLGALVLLGIALFFPPLSLRSEDDCHCFDDETVIVPVPVLFLTPLLMIPGNDLLTEAICWTVLVPEMAGILLVAAALTWAFGKAWTLPERDNELPVN